MVENRESVPCLYPDLDPCPHRVNVEDETFCKAKSGGSCPYISRSPELPHKKPEQVFSERVAGDHYRTMGIQPAEYAYYNQLGFLEGNIVKYVTRWKKKNGIEDLRKARNYIDLLISFEEN